MKNRKYKRAYKKVYQNGGDGMFFYHKKTMHPAKQLSHTKKTWTNRRYTHSPNKMSNYILDEELSDNDSLVYYQKTIFTDSIYTRGKPYNMIKHNKKKKR